MRLLEEAIENYKEKRFRLHLVIASARSRGEVQAILDALCDMEPVMPAELQYRITNRALLLSYYEHEKTDRVFMQQIQEMQEKVKELTREIEG